MIVGSRYTAVFFFPGALRNRKGEKASPNMHEFIHYSGRLPLSVVLMRAKKSISELKKATGRKKCVLQKIELEKTTRVSVFP